MWSPVWCILDELPLFTAVVSDFWVWDSFGHAISEGESLIEVWAVWKGINRFSPVWIIFLDELPLFTAVVSDFWVWDSFGHAISEGESLIEVWAVRKSINGFTPVWILLLGKLVLV